MHSTVNRRTIITSLAAAPAGAVAATLPTQAAEADELSPVVQDAIAAFEEALAGQRACDAEIDAIMATLPEEVRRPIWKPSGDAALDCGLHRHGLQSAEHARMFFDNIIARRSDPDPLTSGIFSGQDLFVARLKRHRADALAYLEPIDAKRRDSGLIAAFESADIADDRVNKARGILIDVPCRTIADARAKAGALMDEDLDAEESTRVLISIAGERRKSEAA